MLFLVPKGFKTRVARVAGGLGEASWSSRQSGRGVSRRPAPLFSFCKLDKFQNLFEKGMHFHESTIFLGQVFNSKWIHKVNQEPPT